jgi:membrane-associated phospholipid phosphatase
MPADPSTLISARRLLGPGLCLLLLLGLTTGAITAGWDGPVAALAKPYGQSGFGQAWARAAYWMGMGGIQMAAMALLGLAGYLWGRRGLMLLGRDGLLAVAASGLLTQIIKHLVGRPRPRMGNASWEVLGPSFNSDLHSFPSGHAATSFALAVVLANRFPHLAPLFYAVAAFIACGRLLGNSHYLADALGGAALGLAVGWLMVLFFRRREAV